MSEQQSSDRPTADPVVLIPTEAIFHEWCAEGVSLCRAVDTHGAGFLWRCLIYLAPLTRALPHNPARFEHCHDSSFLKENALGVRMGDEKFNPL